MLNFRTSFMYIGNVIRLVYKNQVLATVAATLANTAGLLIALSHGKGGRRCKNKQTQQIFLEFN